ncbi:Putative TrmH family tRNA/rRNA methyltransferase [Maioricimonas rarisocia]|uniref:TrmH family tRNA/rRNA methyltransferase n=2 Tax=Maioricimonas rarisocia TaxID=2528026 RepID=A0A517Z5M4_9PLAN|nr:Putative TrmH family tRNA/rRNA methyltransferase [Maioricimonas rarisocia]
MGSHQKCWLWGRNVVLETLRSGDWKPLELLVADRLDPDVSDEVRRLADEAEIPVDQADAADLHARCGTSEHQGLLARMPAFPWRSLESLLEGDLSACRLAVLDGVQDPFNFGAIVRSADVLAMDGILVGTRRQCDITAQVVRSSAGAVSHLPLYRAEDLPAAVAALRQQDVVVAGASEAATVDAEQFDFSGPVAVVIGNEGMGISDALKEQCDALVGIPQQGHVGSLNAAVAASLLFYEVGRQRRQAARDGAE